MKELDNELGFFGKAEDMPDFENVEIPTETTNESPEDTEPEEDTTEEEESEESEEQAPEEAKKAKPSKPNPYEAVILAEMKRRASTDPLLAQGLESKDKSISECFRYVTEQARKEATNNCAMVEDQKVYGWAVHYYIEPKEVIDAELAPKGAKKAPSKEAMKKIHSNPLLEGLMKKGFAPTEDGAVVKTTTAKDGTTKETKVEDKAKTITLKGKAGELTFTQYELF